MKPLILVTSPCGTRSGYGSHSRDIIRSLIAMDKFDVKVWPVRWGNTSQNALDETNPNDLPIIERILSNPNMERQPDIHIHIVIPSEFHPLGKFNIGVTAGLEATAMPPTWIQGLNKMDLNIVPSTFVKNVITDIAFDVQDEKTKEIKGTLKNEKPIEVLFEGADTNIFKKTNKFSKELVDELKTVNESFNFLYVGHWLSGGLGKDRKDTGMMVKVFLETFKNMKKAPGLIMKTSGATVSVLDREEILEKINHIRDTVKGKLPNIYVLHGDLTDDEMNDLYNHPKVKAHLSFTHGEGFGRPLLESTLSQKPVIASNWSGHLDFLPKSSAILIDGSLQKVEKDSFQKDMHVEGMQWFTVNYQEAATKMKDVYKNYRKYTLNAKKLGTINKSKFSLNTMTKEFEKILDKYVPEFPKEVKLTLPKLKKVSSAPPKKITLPKLKRIK